ncbi:hypothetical protein Droror1_Dr00024590 [Drosera rotundifolia]
MTVEQCAQSERSALLRAEQARTLAERAMEVAIRKRQRAQFLMENADLATYRAAMMASISFDILFMVQHFVLYRGKKDALSTSKLEDETKKPLHLIWACRQPARQNAPVKICHRFRRTFAFMPGRLALSPHFRDGFRRYTVLCDDGALAVARWPSSFFRSEASPVFSLVDLGEGYHSTMI